MLSPLLMSLPVAEDAVRAAAPPHEAVLLLDASLLQQKVPATADDHRHDLGGGVVQHDFPPLDQVTDARRSPFFGSRPMTRLWGLRNLPFIELPSFSSDATVDSCEHLSSDISDTSQPLAGIPLEQVCVCGISPKSRGQRWVNGQNVLRKGSVRRKREI